MHILCIDGKIILHRKYTKKLCLSTAQRMMLMKYKSLDLRPTNTRIKEIYPNYGIIDVMNGVIVV